MMFKMRGWHYMKTKLIDRILLAFVLIAMLLICVALIGVALRMIPDVYIQSAIAWVGSGLINSAILGSVSALFLIFTIRLFFAGKKRPDPVPSYSLVKNSEFGSVYITVSALDTMVQKFCRSVSKIRECASAINLSKDGITINLKLSLLPDSNVPELTSELQKGLKEYIESLSGILVQEIGVLVISMSGMTKTRQD
jgi:uncharacterized alkaline shock family protein YloU